MKNQLEIDIASSPDLQELLGAKKVGSTCSLNLTIRITENDGKTVRGTIKKIEKDDYDSEGDIEPSSDEPTAMKITDEKREEATKY